MTARFRRTEPQGVEDGDTVDRFVLELRPGHTVTRVDRTDTMYAGRRGRAAMVTVTRELSCTCGGHSHGGLTVTEDMARLRHFEDAADREAYEAEEAAHLSAILEALGGSR